MMKEAEAHILLLFVVRIMTNIKVKNVHKIRVMGITVTVQDLFHNIGIHQNVQIALTQHQSIHDKIFL